MPGTNVIVMYGAFDKREDGQIVRVFELRQSDREDEAISGAVAWARESRRAVGEIREPMIIF